MVELSLPKNSKIDSRAGKHYPAPADAKSVRRLRIYRFDPEQGGQPRIDTYEIDMASCGPMVLDALLKIKNEIDTTLSLRRSCREGICGSCAMNINGQNTLACTKACDELGDGDIRDLSAAAHAGGQGPGYGSDTFLRAVRRREALAAKPHARGRRIGSACSRRKTRNASIAPRRASCAPAVRRHARATGGTRERYLGPAALLAAYRWIVDSRDEATGERLDALEDPFRLYRCHTIMNCTEACPKDLNPAKAIGAIKRLLADRRY